MGNYMHFIGKYDSYSIEECIKNKLQVGMEIMEILNKRFISKIMLWNGGTHLTIMRRKHFKMKNLNESYYTSGLMPRRRIKRELRVYFHVTNSYYKFMDVFKRRRSSFLLTLVARKISSVLIWLTDCNFPQKIFITHKVMMRMFKFLKI